MLYIKNFQDWKESQILEFYSYVDSLLQVNESLSVDKIKEKWNKILNRVKLLPEKLRKRAISYALLSLLSISTYNVVVNAIEINKIEDESIKNLTELIIGEYSNEKLFKSPQQLRLSKNGREEIKKAEGLKLKAYKLGDGMVTMGWGHAEPTSKSKYKLGHKISMEDAIKYFNEDVQIAADGVRRIFSEWESKGVYIKLTQDQFDVLVSMAFNMGVNGLRRTEIIKLLKSGNHKAAGEKIKTTKISKKFPGLENRRNSESRKFLSFLE